MTRTTLHLVRHAEQATTGDRAVDDGLTPRGREQARHTGRRLSGAPLSAVHHSPLPRAAETADLIAHHLPRVPVHACGRVMDRTPVPSEGRRPEYPPGLLPWLDAVPAAERDVDAERLQEAVAHLGRVGEQERHELLVSHAFVIGRFVRHVMDAPTWRWTGLAPASCALTVLRWETSRSPALLAFDDVGHLPTALCPSVHEDGRDPLVDRSGAHGPPGRRGRLEEVPAGRSPARTSGRR